MATCKLNFKLSWSVNLFAVACYNYQSNEISTIALLYLVRVLSLFLSYLQNYLICSKLEQNSDFWRRGKLYCIHKPFHYMKKTVSLDAQQVTAIFEHTNSIPKWTNKFIYISYPKLKHIMYPPNCFSLSSNILPEKVFCTYLSISVVFNRFCTIDPKGELCLKTDCYQIFFRCLKIYIFKK